MLFKQYAIGIMKLLCQLRAAFDVGEEECDETGWNIVHFTLEEIRNYELRITSYELHVTSYKLLITHSLLMGIPY